MPLNTPVEDIAQVIYEFNVSAQVSSDYLRFADRALVEAAYARLSKFKYGLQTWRTLAA